LVLVALFLPPSISLPRLRARIARSMEAALGRKVKIGEVTLRVLPRPGFDLHYLSIADDPAFGAEPMVSADDVTLALRLASLWRGRLEVAALSFKSGVDINPPSLNLVRNAEGRWNIEALLRRASQTPSAPTAQAKAEVRPRFPYIEISGGRINFKSGQEKTVYVLSEADFALWLAAENEWRFRLAARPVRTDLNLSDTGVVKANGWFRRAAALRDTPLEVSVTLQDAQLGALTKLAYGRDRGWRGTVAGTAHFAGAPTELRIGAEAQVRDFRRYDISTTDSLRLQVRCTALYRVSDGWLSGLDCQAPIGNGRILVRGEVEGLSQTRSCHLSFTAESVGVQALVLLAHHVKKDLAGDLSARGELGATLDIRKPSPDEPAVWSGGGHTSEVVLTSSLLTPGLLLPELAFAIEGPSSDQNRPPFKGPQHAPSLRVLGGLKNVRRAPRRPAPVSPELRFHPREPKSGWLGTPFLVLAPFRLPMGASSPLEVRGWLSRLGYQLELQGDARVSRLLQAAHALGLPALPATDGGSAIARLQMAGLWAGFGSPRIMGEAQVRDVSVSVRGLNGPLQVASADLQLGSEETLVQHLALRFPGFGVQFSGSARLPRYCAMIEQCALEFDLQADRLSLDDLNRLANPALAKRAWYQVFSSPPSGSLLGRLRAHGQLAVNQLSVKSLTAQHFSAEVELARGVLRLGDAQVDVLGGQYRGDWHGDFTGTQPKYEGTGSLRGVAMSQLAALMHDNWATGILDATGQTALSGSSAAELVSSLEASGEFEWRNGLLRHVTLDSRSGPLAFRQFTGQFDLRRGILALTQSRMSATTGLYQVGGTVSLSRQLSLTLRNGTHLYDLSGTLDAPKITPASETRAALQ
jgi:hypothetical protein